MVSAREDGFTTDVSLNIQLFSKKAIWITFFEFQFTFSTKNEHGGSLLLSEARKTVRTISVYYTKFRNTSTAAQTITGGRLDKVGWIESHNYHKRLIKHRKPSMLILGDSIAKGLRRYMDVWDRYLGKHTVNLGIGGDKVEGAIWRIGNLAVNKEVRYVVLICGTNNIDKNIPADIVKGIKYASQLMKYKFYNCKVIVSGILPRDYSPGTRRNKIRVLFILFIIFLGSIIVKMVLHPKIKK